MSRGNPIKVLRTSRANLDVQKAASGLIAGEPYLITDEGRIAVATAVDAYQAAAKQDELVSSAIAATTTNDNASAGYIGQFISSTRLLAAATALTTNVAATITYAVLPAGDWDVRGQLGIVGLTSLTATAVEVCLSEVNNTLDTTPGRHSKNMATQAVGTSTTALPLATTRFSLASTTTIYLVARCAFSSGTCAGYGTIEARRVR